jgi:integrase
MLRNREQKGSVVRIGGYWCLRYADWRIENGRRLRKQGLTHKLTPVLEEHKRLKRPPKYVEKLQEEFIERVNGSRSAPETCCTIEQFIGSMWLPFVETRHASSTLAAYRYYWKNILKPYVGDQLLRDFTTAQAEIALNDIARHNLNMRRATLHKLRSMLSAIFKRSIGLGYRSGPNPCREVTLPKALPSRPTYAYTLQEIRQMLSLISHEATRVIIALAAYCGLSRSEIQGLCWEAYDAATGEITVLSSVVNGKRGDPKTEARRNSVPLIQPARELLDLYRLLLGNPICGVMFGTKRGTPVDLHNVFCDNIDTVINACQECGAVKAEHREADHEYHRFDRVEWHGWHAFRRGLASNLYDLGLPDLLIQRILRHSDVNTTRKSYIKVREPNVTAGMAQLEAEIRKVEMVQ